MALASGSPPQQANSSSSRSTSTGRQNNNGSHHNGANSTSYVPVGSPSSSSAFQQVKHTQASLARLSRVQHQHQQASNSQTNQSSQQANQSANNSNNAGGTNNGGGSSSSSAVSRDNQFSNQQTQTNAGSLNRSTTFVDCLIRRFKDCFNEDSFSVPMFVVGSLSPGVDGTQLILPPCVSLGRQSISRFAGPKNLRLMNSIRESCRSIEELDLGGNKLTDLIEVYKILQCTPNLRFLNLSENDLSRSSPVAMASPASAASLPSANQSSIFAANHPGNTTASQWQSSSPSISSSAASAAATISPAYRSCLAPISQNQQSSMSTRRHSALGQPTAMTTRSSTSSLTAGQRPQRQAPGTRLSETRRLAATAALAQSKKTSSTLASKLASSANLEAAVSTRRRQSLTAGIDRSTGAQPGERLAQGPESRPQDSKSRLLTSASSTMHLARSLSSLSAKDIRGSSSRAIGLTSKCSLRSLNQRQRPQNQLGQSQNQRRPSLSPRSSMKQQMVVSKSSGELTSDACAESIDESEDVEMGTNQTSNIQTSNTSTSNLAARHTPPQARQALVQHTGSNVMNKGSNINQPTMTTTNFRRTFRSLKALALNNTGCQWRVVCSILSRMPNLEELHLSLNNYERIDLDVSEFRHNSLKRLYLCNNPKLTNWQELNKLLIAFPSLEALSIADCNISQIPDNLDRASEWRKLCGLNINGWPIKEWPVIERLNQLPSLIDLKCRNLEVLQSIDEPRHHLIARLPKLQRLNGSEIEERDHAEKVFLRFFIENSHLERPSRFHELIQIHGELPPMKVDVDVDLSPPSHARVRVVHLNRNYYRKENEDDVLISEDFLTKLMDSVEMDSSTSLNNSHGACTMDTDDTAQRLFKDEGQEVVAIDVDLRQSVRKFKQTLSQIFGLTNHSSLILYYIDHEMVGLMGPELLRHNQKKLWNFNVQDGDQFIVEER